jgi:hypothetical protein
MRIKKLLVLAAVLNVLLIPNLGQASDKWQLVQVVMTGPVTLETYRNQKGETLTLEKSEVPRGSMESINEVLTSIARSKAAQEQTGSPDIKARTEKSVDPTDPAEFHNYNLQRVFNWGFAMGQQMLRVSDEAQQRIRDGDTSGTFVDISGGIRLPYPFLKRFMFGGSIAARNGLRAPSENVPWAPPDGDGFTTYPLPSDSYKTIFAEYDVLVLGDDAKAAFSAGVFKGFAKTNQDTDHPYKYTDSGYTLKARFFAGSGRWGDGTVWELSPFIVYRRGSNKVDALYGGLGFSFGPQMKMKKKKQK